MKVKVVLRNPLNKEDFIDYDINVHDHELGRDWVEALKGLLRNCNQLEKNFCFMGFPLTPRNLDYLCYEVNQAVLQVNSFFRDEYLIEEVFTPENVVGFDYADNGINHEVLNKLHNHFEVLQGTVNNLSDYYRRADYNTKYAIRQLNLLCHEMESLILSQRKFKTDPFWVRPSQITTFLNTPRLDLKDSHRELFVQNGYDRKMGGVYMHWTQIGKTLFEVFRDEHAPKLDATVCEAITHLQYYSGEFDVEWGNDVVRNGGHPWHDTEQNNFEAWLRENNLDPTDPKLSLGYLPIGEIDLMSSIGTDDCEIVWDILGAHLDIYRIEVDGVANTFPYSWADPDFKARQIHMMKPGYDHSSSRG